jgi:hypothetical protein
MSGKPTSNLPQQAPNKVVYPVPTGNQVSSFGVPKFVQPEGLWAHKNVMGRGKTVMNEYFVGQTLTLTGVVGTFQVAEEIWYSNSDKWRYINYNNGICRLGYDYTGCYNRTNFRSNR